MAYDEKLAGRIRAVIARINGSSEKKMFGGLCFLVNGHMVCGVVKDEMMVRVGPDAHASLLLKPHARVMDFTGQPMKGMLYVGVPGLKTKAQLDKWVGHCLAFVETLPPKTAKKSLVTSAPKKKATKAKAKRADTTEGAFDGFPKSTFDFLKALDKNNSKAWFDAHRDDYQSAYVEPGLAFVAALGPRLQKISKTIRYEPRINGSMFRINRDVRFSKDKTPYKNHLDLWFWEGAEKGWNTPGFFFRLLSDRLIFGSGMHKFETAQLEKFRSIVVDNRKGAALETVLQKVTDAGAYKIGAPTRKKVPRGFDGDHPRAALLLHEGLVVTWEGKPPSQIKSAAFVDWCAAHAKAFRPLHEWLLKNL